MADRRKLSPGNEEKLSFQVKKFPCLFDKTDKGYKEKNLYKQCMESCGW